MDETSFWVCIWAIVAACFLGLVFSITAYQVYAEKTLAQSLIDNPQRPALDVVCGLNHGTTDICAIRAAIK